MTKQQTVPENPYKRVRHSKDGRINAAVNDVAVEAGPEITIVRLRSAVVMLQGHRRHDDSSQRQNSNQLKDAPLTLPSWQAASGLIAQELQIVLALNSRAIGEDPRRKPFNTGLRAHRLNALRAFDSALNIRRVLKRRTEFLFLILAMRAPKRTIHFGLLGGKALGKSIQFLIVPAAKGNNMRPQKLSRSLSQPSRNASAPDLTPLGFALAVSVAFFFALVTYG